MNLLGKIGSLYKEPVDDTLGDDNIAVSREDNNPFIATAVLGARNAYDTLHYTLAPVLKSKEVSLKQIDRVLKIWIDRLNDIAQMYEELIAKINEISADMEGTFSIDFAKEAWELIQDTPILRRYIGEANYWLLHDTVGLLATQANSISADVLSGIKEALKQCILGLLAMTDGLLCLESYLSMIQQYWGALYLKVIPVPLLDSIVPNVTTAYWYKLPDTSSSGVTNDPPGWGFTPIPVPIPEPVMFANNPAYIAKLDMCNPSTWYYEGSPYYMSNTMTMLYRALNYWGSSYTNAYLPLINNLYPRRDYTVGGEKREHPLQVGRTFAQIDTDKTTIKGTKPSESTIDVKQLFENTFNEPMVAAMREWQEHYERAKTALLDFLTRGFAAYGEDVSTINRFVALQQESTGYPLYDDWRETNGEYLAAIKGMLESWNTLVAVYAAKNNLDASTVASDALYDTVMDVFTRAGGAVKGYQGSIEAGQVFVSAPSYSPAAFVDSLWEGIPNMAYVVDTTSGVISAINSGADTTVAGDSAQGTYKIVKPSFAMFPSNVIDMEAAVRHIAEFNLLANTIRVNLVDVAADLALGAPINEDAVILEYTYGDTATVVVGSVKDSLHKRRACGASTLGRGHTRGNIFFPDGDLTNASESKTFVTLYDDFVNTAEKANDELGEIVGYAINKGREIKFPCFGVYGNLLSMQSFDYKEMPYASFKSNYARTRSGSDLYYNKANPENVILYHSQHYSVARQMYMAIYHEALASQTKSVGASTYNYYVYPCESVSVSKVSSSPSLGSLLSVDAIGTSGDQYHYTTLSNTIPKCAKYVDPMKWSVLDIIHEMYLLASNLSSLCGDNGERLRAFEKDIEAFGISPPTFVGQLPENNGEYVTYECSLFEEYATKIEEAVAAVYVLRDKLIGATNTL